MKKYIYFLGLLLSLFSVPSYAAITCPSAPYIANNDFANYSTAELDYFLSNQVNGSSVVNYANYSRKLVSYNYYPCGVGSSVENNPWWSGTDLNVMVPNGACNPGYAALYVYHYNSYSDTASCEYQTALPPYSAEPAHCSDGQYSGDEIGDDCGGSCIASCIATCPPGTTAAIVTTEGQSVTKCSQTVSASNYGMCPDLVNWTYDQETSTCWKDVEPYLSANPATLPPVADPWTNESTSTTSTTISQVDNQDGTSTKTTTGTTVNSDGSTTSTVTTEILDNQTGGLVSSETTTTIIKDAPGNNWSEDAQKIIQSEKLSSQAIVDAINNQHQQFADGLTETVNTDSATILSGIDSQSNLSADEIQSLATDDMTAIKNEHTAAPSSFPVEQTITTQAFGLLPASQDCQPINLSVTAGKVLTIDCFAINKIKTLLGYVFAFLTFLYIYSLVFHQDIIKD